MTLNEPAIIKSNSDFYVYWMLGDKCTYSCSYCSPSLHSGSYSFHPLETVLKTYAKIPKPATIMFSGGEPTYHPDFEEIVRQKPPDLKIGVITNLSRPLAFWERVSNFISVPVLTYHIEFANLERFITSAKHIFENCDRNHNQTEFIRINLPMSIRQWNDCQKVYYRLKDENLPVVPKPLIELGKKITSFEQKVNIGYSSEQLNWINNENLESDNFKPISVYNKEKKLLYNTNGNELLSNNQTNFQNWLCYAPVEGINIRFNGDVRTMICKQGETIGNIFSDFKIPTDPVICNLNLCWCQSDIPRTKIKYY